MNKTELINKMSEVGNLTKKDAGIALEAFKEVVATALSAGDKIQLIGFISLETVNVPQKTCRNPKDGSSVVVPAHKKVRVKIGQSLKDTINK